MVIPPPPCAVTGLRSINYRGILFPGTAATRPSPSADGRTKDKRQWSSIESTRYGSVLVTFWWKRIAISRTIELCVTELHYQTGSAAHIDGAIIKVLPSWGRHGTPQDLYLVLYFKFGGFSFSVEFSVLFNSGREANEDWCGWGSRASSHEWMSPGLITIESRLSGWGGSCLLMFTTLAFLSGCSPKTDWKMDLGKGVVFRNCSKHNLSTRPFNFRAPAVLAITLSSF